MKYRVISTDTEGGEVATEFTDLEEALARVKEEIMTNEFLASVGIELVNQEG